MLRCVFAIGPHARLHCDELADVMAESGYHAFMRSNSAGGVPGHALWRGGRIMVPALRRGIVAMPLLRRQRGARIGLTMAGSRRAARSSSSR